MDTSVSTLEPVKINLHDVIEELFLVLTTKEKDVIIKRFSLDNKPRRTLESIGQHFSVTRERVRQIEKIALGKLRRTVQTSRLKVVNEVANRVLEESGGVLTDKILVSKILKVVLSHSDADPHIVRLALNINPEIVKTDKSTTYKTFWRFSHIPNDVIDTIIKTGVKVLKKKGDIMFQDKLVIQIRQTVGEKITSYSDPMIVSTLQVDKRIKLVEDGNFGLMDWRHINPKSIRDKAYIILKNSPKPLHFVEIANRIASAGFDKKIVTTQAVHNELIRYDQFVLVGRGLYALKESGYNKGTVADIIESLLSKRSPMTKQEIIEGVLKQRFVKKGTISLNLQKNPQFQRVGRAVYTLDKSKR